MATSLWGVLGCPGCNSSFQQLTVKQVLLLICVSETRRYLFSMRSLLNDVQGLDETPLTYVDTLPALEALASELALASEVAVDLEAHSYRSFQGFCCLMQISTRQADYLVDVIRLRSAIGPCLGPFFADAKACTHSL